MEGNITRYKYNKLQINSCHIVTIFHFTNYYWYSRRIVQKIVTKIELTLGA